MLPGLSAAVNTVTEVRLRRGDGTTRHLEQARPPSGWSPSATSPPSAERCANCCWTWPRSVVEEKTRLPANYATLDVEDASGRRRPARASMSSAGGQVGLIVGKSAGAHSVYVRLADSPQSLLASPAPPVDADPKGWLERALIDVAPERVREIEEHPAQGAAFTVARAKAEQNDFTVTPLPKGRELSSPGAANALAAALSSLTLEDVSKAAAAPRGGCGTRHRAHL